MKAKGTYTVKKWDEATYKPLGSDRKLTKAAVEYQFSGEIEGKGDVEYLMFYSHVDPKDQHKSSAAYVGLVHFDGTLSGKTGSFVLEDSGTFQAGAAKSSLRIVEDSGTGQLKGIHGTGTYVADQEGLRIELEYEW